MQNEKRIGISPKHDKLTGFKLVQAVLKDTRADSLMLRSDHVQEAKKALGNGHASPTLVNDVFERLTQSTQERLLTSLQPKGIIFDAHSITNT